MQICLRPKDVTQQEASKILYSLNSLNSAEEMASVIASYAGHNVLSIRIAQRIMTKKRDLGRFQDLQQVAVVPGIGTKRFAGIIDALGDHA
jgi:hypothetical protein